MQPRVVLKKKAAREYPELPAPPVGTGDLVFTCAGGLEPLVEQELSALGYGEFRRRSGAVYCAGDGDDARDLVRWVRTASRILLPILRFTAATYESLYYRVKQLPWREILPPRFSFAITATTRSRTMRDHRFLAMRTKDAIVDRQRREGDGSRSSVDRDNPHVSVVVFIDADDTVEISLDASGAPLHERGYRRESGSAPLRETVAAAMLLQAGYGPDQRGKTPVLVDPFCGSGTIAIEAALIASRRAPQPAVRTFACDRWTRGNARPVSSSANAPPSEHATGPTSSSADAPPSLETELPRIFASDNDPNVVEIARRNAIRAGVEELIDFSVGDARSGLPGSADLVVTNPPYGERLEQKDLQELYREFGVVLKRELPGGTAWILCPHKKLAQRTGLRASRRIPMYNGGLSCVFYEFVITAGGA